MKTNTCFGFLIALTVACDVALCQTAPRLLPFQGRLTDQNGVAVSNGVRLVQFKIFEVPSGGSPVWAGELHRTTVNGGLVNVLLGSKTAFTSVDFDRQLYLEITVDINGDNTITAADPPMLPRQAILPVIFSKQSGDSRKLIGYDWSAVLDNTNASLGKLLSSKIADGQVDSRILANGAVMDRHVGILSHLTSSDGSRTNALEINDAGDVHIDGNVRMDRNVIVGSLDAGGGVTVGSSSFGGQSIELRISNGQPPFLDFSNDPTTDFDARIILQDNNSLRIVGANLLCDDELSAARVDVRGTIIDSGGLNVGSSSFGAQSVELRISNGQPTFIDFSNDPSTDFDARIMLAGDNTLQVAGADLLVSDGGVIANDLLRNSDRSLKTDFSAVDAAEILHKVVNLPIQVWRFTNDPPTLRHIGPMAQDFQGAFHYNQDNKRISTADVDGVTLAAIQGLHQMMKEKDQEIAALKKSMEEMQKAVTLLLRESKHTKQ